MLLYIKANTTNERGLTMITKIDITETVQTMGETSAADAELFCDFLRAELVDEYPDAEISVTLNNRISSTVIYVETDLDEDGCPTNMNAEDEIQEFINRKWDTMEW
jgi:hypothetical protein